MTAKGGVAVAAPPATIGLGHTRWATHGRVTEENAHPTATARARSTSSSTGSSRTTPSCAASSRADGHIFTSETDAEIVAHLIERHYDGELTEAVRAAFDELRGHYAFVAMHAEHPETLVAARQECPLIVGLGEGETFVASAIPAFLAETRTVLGARERRDRHGRRRRRRGSSTPTGPPVERDVDEVTWDEDTAEKGGYATFMLKEIHEQPDAVAETITDRLPDARPRRPLRARARPPSSSTGLRRIVIVACGTSYHAGLVGRYAIEQWARVPVEMDIASEYRYRDPVVGDGRPRHRHHPVRRDGRHAGGDAPRARARRDRARAHQRDGQPGDARRRRRALHPLRDSRSASPRRRRSSPRSRRCTCSGSGSPRSAARCPDERIDRADRRAQGAAVARSRRRSSRSSRPGQGDRPRGAPTASSSSTSAATSACPVCLEGALKMKEISYIPSDAYAAGEMKHGPIALLDESTPVVCVATDSPILDKMLSNMEEVRARGADVIAIATEGTQRGRRGRRPDDRGAREPTGCCSRSSRSCRSSCSPTTSPACAGLNVDQPRNLAKTVTVE